MPVDENGRRNDHRTNGAATERFEKSRGAQFGQRRQAVAAVLVVQEMRPGFLPSVKKYEFKYRVTGLFMELIDRANV